MAGKTRRASSDTRRVFTFGTDAASFRRSDAWPGLAIPQSRYPAICIVRLGAKPESHHSSARAYPTALGLTSAAGTKTLSPIKGLRPASSPTSPP